MSHLANLSGLKHEHFMKKFNLLLHEPFTWKNDNIGGRTWQLTTAEGFTIATQKLGA